MPDGVHLAGALNDYCKTVKNTTSMHKTRKYMYLHNNHLMKMVFYINLVDFEILLSYVTM